MKKSSLVTLALTSLLTLGTSMNAFAESVDREAVQASINAFYVALNKLFVGKMTPMERVWSDKDDITYMGPDGNYLKGWVSIQATLKDVADKKIGGKVESKDLNIVIGKELAVANNYEVGQNMDENGNPVKVAIRATSIFRKENDTWKMISHHTDTLSILKK